MLSAIPATIAKTRIAFILSIIEFKFVKAFIISSPLLFLALISDFVLHS